MTTWPFSRRTPDPDRSTFNVQFASLIWPKATPSPASDDTTWQNDLGLRDLVREIAYHHGHQAFVQQVLTALTPDVEVIRWRQAVLDDLRNNPELVAGLNALLPRLADMREDNSLLGNRERGVLTRTAERLAELEIYTDVVIALHTALHTARLESVALQDLRKAIQTLINDANFKHLQDKLPQLRQPLQRITSLTIGINLDTELRPRSAVLMAINDFEIGEPLSFLEKALGTRPTGDERTGIAPLHYTPADARQKPLSPLYQDLEKLMSQVAEPVERFLRQYTNTNTAPIIHLEYEFGFFLGALRLFDRLHERGISLCRPEILPPDERRTTIDGLINVGLVLRGDHAAVPSRADFDDSGRIAILTGPNSGGKTTYLRSVGLAQVLAQAGLFITAESAQISPVDRIHTHFPALETRKQGRLAEEASRLKTIFGRITRHSLVLLNETFATTSASEAVYLAQDVMCGLRMIGVRAIFATHLTELTRQIEEIEATVDGESRVCSLVAGITFDDENTGHPTFEIKRGLPLGRSYAQEIARRHGIDLDQIMRLTR